MDRFARWVIDDMATIRMFGLPHPVPETPVTDPDDRARVAAMRGILPYQFEADSAACRLDAAQARFGLAFEPAALRAILRRQIPWWAFTRRDVDVCALMIYRPLIPDAAILRYADARESSLFGWFEVWTPDYGSSRARCRDPWLIGAVDRDHLIVLASWADPR